MIESGQKLFDSIRAHKLIFGIGAGGVVFVLLGIVSLFSAGDDTSVRGLAVAEKGDMRITTSADISPVKQKKIIVDVSGAVRKPGVYTLEGESRIKDALLMAGGISDNADRLRVAQTLNLAAKLSDGAKIYIPALGEQQVTAEEVSQSMSANDSQSITVGNGININQASESELDTLPGVGKVTVEKIIANRPYESINELTQKKVVGASVFEKIKDKISTY